MRRLTLAAAAATVASILACMGGGGETVDPAVEAALEGLEGTALEGTVGNAAQVFDLKGGGAPPMDSGNGVQVVHVAPLGDGRKALQAAVVFDRPMVPLSDLDAMSDVPLDCTPAIPHRARWAGTTTAVWIPEDGSFPLAHAFTCAVPAGTPAIDGVALENRIEWTFETARPAVGGSSPRDGHGQVDPDSPIDLWFTQPVTVEQVAPFISLSEDGGRKLAIEITEGKNPSAVVIKGSLESDQAYVLRVAEGFVGENGPLPSTEAYTARFETYPPLELVSFGPTGAVEPSTRLEAEFTTGVSDEAVAKVLTIEPEPEGWSLSTGTWASSHWSTWHVFAPRTTYKVTIGAGLEDQFGQTLGKPATIEFTTGDYRPGVDVATGFQVYAANNSMELPLRHLNCDDVHVEVTPLPLEQTLKAWRGRYADVATAALAGSDAVRIDVETSDEPNMWEIDKIDLEPYFSTGMVAIDTWSPQHVTSWSGEVIHQRAVLARTALGLTLKVGPHATQAWVTSLETGEPVAGVDVVLFLDEGTLGSAKTDKTGLAVVEASPGNDWSRWEDPVVGLARKGEDIGIAVHNWSDGIDPWRFGLYADWDGDGKRGAAWGYADRGIYRPGDPVNAMAHYRVEHKDGMSVPEDGTAEWTLSGPEGDEVASGKAPVKRGNASIQTTLPEDGMLGDYSLRVTYEMGPQLSRTVYLEVPARAYREPAFRVSVHADESALSGEELTGHLDARYMFGAPLANGDVTWRAWTDPARFEPEGFDGFWFGPERRWWWEDEVDDGTGTLSSHETTVAEGGDWTLTAPDGLDRPVDLSLEAEVTDVDRQSIAGSTRLRIHPTSAYVGVRAAERLPQAETSTSFEVLALTPEGERAEAATTTLEVIKRTWTYAREKGVDGRWEHVSKKTEEVVHTEERSVGGNKDSVSWTPDAPGTYVIRATRKEGSRSQVAEDRIYVRGKGIASWGLDEDNMLRLVPDKQRYHLGDTARILVQSPVPDLEALVTVEREGVLWSRVQKLEGTAATVEIPIQDAWLPNVYVSVVAVEGAPPQDSPDAGRPQVRVGMVDLAVDKEDARVKVAIETDQDVYGPRDQVEVDLALTYADGSAAADMDVVLYAVDEAVLSLTDYQTPDPISGLIGHRELSAHTGDSRTQLLDRARYLTKGADDGGGGGMGESGPEIRERFLTTIAWKPDLRSDSSGKVHASFELPDNLTAFRIMAVATSDDRFGSGDREITVTRPLIARPALPRRMRGDDVAFAGVVVHNNTDSDTMVTVAGEVTGPIDLLGSPVLVKVKAHEALEVPFRLKATGPGDAEFLFEVKGGGNKDALKWPLVVEEDIPLEVVATSGSVEDSVTERIGTPRTERPDLGGLSVDIGTSALAGAGSGLDYLLEYPHGCLEQTTSRGLGALMALRVREHAGLELDEEQLKRVVEAALAEISEFELRSGRGLGYWRGSIYPSPMGTAYAVELMGRAKEAGFKVDEPLLSESSAFLRDVLAGKELRHWTVLDSLQVRAYTAVALARAGKGDAGHNQTLYGSRNDLSVASTAALMEAIARTTGPDSRTATLATAIESRTWIDAASASVKENESGRWARLWGSDDLSTAAALEALLVANGEHPLAPKFALHLASSKTSGRWANTRATAGVLAALAAYAERYEKGDGERTATVALAGKQLLKESLAIPEAAHANVALGDLEEGELVVSAEGGRVYYEHRLAYAPVDAPPRDEGFTVIREVEIVDGGGPDGQVTAGATLAITLRVVTPVVRHDVAVVDAIPAGWEPLDSSLATTSKAPSEQPDTSGDDEGGTDELPAFGGSWVYDHHEIDDLEVRLYADYMPPGIHTFRYAARATTPGEYGHPPARAEAMYEPEVFGRTQTGTMVVGRRPAMASAE